MKPPYLQGTVLLLASVVLAAGAEPPHKTAPSSESNPSVSSATTSAADKFWQALQLLNRQETTNQERGRALLQESADGEFTAAQVLLADCSYSGAMGFPKDAKRSAGLLRLAAERGNAYGMIGYARCLFEGAGTRRDVAKARTWVTKALVPNADYSRPMPPPDYRLTTSPRKSGDDDGRAGRLAVDPAVSARATAHYLLGLIEESSRHPADGQQHFIAAANAGPDGRFGFYPAAVKAALNYAFGTGVPRDLAKANAMLAHSRKLNERAGLAQVQDYLDRRQGDEFAASELEAKVESDSAAATDQLQFAITAMLADRSAKTYNPKEALKWCELAAERGQVWAMLSLAFIYSEGTLAPQDPVKAFGWFEKLGSGDPPKHLLGAANLAICLQNGIGTAPDRERAGDLFYKFKDYDIACYLGYRGECPAVPVNDAKSLALLREWAEQRGDPQAQMLLGLRWLMGWGMPTDRQKAYTWFATAAAAKHPGALFQLGKLYESKFWSGPDRPLAGVPTSSLACFEQAAALGNPDALFALAASHQEETEGTPAQTESAKLYRRCLELRPDFAAAHNNLATILRARLQRAEKDIATARFLGDVAEEQAAVSAAAALEAEMLEHFRKAEALGSAEAAFNLGMQIYAKATSPSELRDAYKHFEQAAAFGLPAAHFLLGRMHERGHGVPVTLTEAAFHYRLAALDEDRDAQRALARLYLEGRGVEADPERAEHWLRQLTKRGGDEDLLLLGDVQLKVNHYAEALQIFQDLATRRNEPIRGAANDRLARIFAEGLGVPADPTEAERCRERALLFEYGPAVCRTARDWLANGQEIEALGLLERLAPRCGEAASLLGELYLTGQHVEKDVQRGWTLLRTAVEKGVPAALYAAASTTLAREPLAPPVPVAITLVNQAEDAGYPGATELREKLERMLADVADKASEPSEDTTGPRAT